MRIKIKRMLRSLGAVALVSTAFLQAFGQGESEYVRRENERDIEQRVFNLGLLRAGKSRTRKSETNVVLAEVQEDFNRLQVVDNDLAEKISRS